MHSMLGARNPLLNLRNYQENVIKLLQLIIIIIIFLKHQLTQKFEFKLCTSCGNVSPETSLMVIQI